MKTALLCAMASLLVLSPAGAGEDHKGARGGDPDQRWQRLLEHVDANHDGKISRDEFTSKGDGLFERLDKDGDGSVTRSEVDAIERPRAKERAQAWLERTDANHDGKVTKDEAKAGRARRFDALDADRDGFLTKDEAAKERGGERAAGSGTGAGEGDGD